MWTRAHTLISSAVGHTRCCLGDTSTCPQCAFQHITKSSSATGHTRCWLGNTITCPQHAFWHITKSSAAGGTRVLVLPSWHLVHPVADDDFDACIFQMRILQLDQFLALIKVSFFINPSFGSPFKSLLFLLLLLLFLLSSMLSLWLLLLLFSTDFFSTFIVCFFTSLHIPVWYYFSFSLNNVIILILLLPLSPLLIY